jgi:hypothetical protein
MPDESGNSLPPQGASAQELLQTLLPLVVKAASDSAAAATAASSAMVSLEGKLDSFEKALQANTLEVTRLADAQEKENKARENGQAWLRTLFTPQTVFLLLVIIASAIGIRLSIPTPVQMPVSVEVPVP